MVLHRMREHVATHNWFAVAVDVGIVVVGVFLGMQANNWNATRIERAEAFAYRAQIIENLRANEIDIGSRSAYYRQVHEHSIAALAVLETPGAVMDEAFLINAYQASQVRQRPLAQSAFDEMSAAGLGWSVGGPDTRATIAAFYAQMPQFNATTLSHTAYRDILRRAMPYNIQRQIRLRCGGTTRQLPGGVVGAVLIDKCVVGFDDEAVAHAATRLGAARDLDLDLTRHIADIDQKLGSFQNYQRRARELREHLESLDRN